MWAFYPRTYREDVRPRSKQRLVCQCTFSIATLYNHSHICLSRSRRESRGFSSSLCNSQKVQSNRIYRKKAKMWHEARRSERKVHDMMDAARKRAQRRAVFLAKRRGDPQQSIQVIGSRCRMYRDDGLYQATQDQQGL